MEYLYSDITKGILSCAFDLFNELGPGFYEKVYENGLIYLLNEKGIYVEQQVPCDVLFRGKVLGEYIADLIVENSVIIELKTSDEVTGYHKAQLINYLRATNYEVGLVICFGKNKVHYGRVTNDYLAKSTGMHIE